MNHWLKKERDRRKLITKGDWVVYDSRSGKPKDLASWVGIMGAIGPYEVLSDMLWNTSYNGYWGFYLMTELGPSFFPAGILIRPRRTVA